MGPTSSEPAPNFASIDIGSHTIRLLIAELRNHMEILPVRTERAVTRLAKNFYNGKSLAQSSMQKSIEVLRTYQELLQGYRVSSFACGATGVLRRATNSNYFIQQIQNLTGMNISLLSEESEATLSARGILSVLPHPPERIVSFDLGGSSTEFMFIDSRQPEPVWSESVFIGAATITERYLTADPPREHAINAASNAIQDALAPVLTRLRVSLTESGNFCEDLQVIGTAGTVTTLAAMYLEMDEYEPYRVNGLSLDKRWLKAIIDKLAILPIASRRGIPGLETGREDIILGGALIVWEILEGLRQNRLTATDAGLLEGLLIDLIETQCRIPHALHTPLTWHWQKM